MTGKILLLSLAIPLTVDSRFLFASPTPPQHEFRVVLDPGHGGADEGTIYYDRGMKVAEKDITLLIARQVARELGTQGYSIFLTRKDDREVPLAERTALANQLGASVFLSIHMNSTSTPMVTDAEGVETYILNNATDASSKRLARLENSVLPQRRFDSPEQLDVALILKDLRLDANLTESKRLACALQSHLAVATSTRTHGSRIRNRGVKQALFHVLLGADMPSVLVESGFLTNPYDRGLVLSVRGQRAISHAISQAITRFKRDQGTSRAHFALSRCKVN